MVKTRCSMILCLIERNGNVLPLHRRADVGCYNVIIFNIILIGRFVKFLSTSLIVFTLSELEGYHYIMSFKTNLTLIHVKIIFCTITTDTMAASFLNEFYECDLTCSPSRS